MRLTGDIRRNVAYTTDARIIGHETRAADAGKQSVRLVLDASEGGRSFLLNITPRLGFNRYIPDLEQDTGGGHAPVARLVCVCARKWPRNIGRSTTTPGG